MNNFGKIIKIDLSKIDKVLYGLSEKKSINLTEKTKMYLMLNKNISPLFNLIKEIEDPYPYQPKKMFIYLSDHAYPMILHEYQHYLYAENTDITIITKTINSSICVICHIGNIEIGYNLLSYLENFEDIKFDLWVSIHSDKKGISETIVYEIKQKFKNVNILFVENMGLDIGPFFLTLKEINKTGIKYDYILKIHTKCNEPSNLRERLMKSCLGSKNIIIHNLMTLADKDIGMVSTLIVSKMDYNMYHFKRIIKKVYNQNNIDVSKVLFVGGTIFWIKASIIYDILSDNLINWFIDNMNDGTTLDGNWMNINNNSNVGNILWPSYSIGKRDGMFEHACERFFGYMILMKNLKISDNPIQELSNIADIRIIDTANIVENNKCI